jgi:GH25 family lysozyme M1 (1,4-beta-N-acetylmuramidase)
MIYTSHIMWLMLGDPKGFAGRPLWLARYAPDPGVVPGDFGDWEFWQATQNGTVPGVQGPVDRNYFHGTAPDLKTRFGL